MSIQVTDFKWEKGKNDLKYIELLEKTLKNEQEITAKAVAKIRKLSAENKEIRAKAIDEFAERLKDSLIHNYRHLLKVDTDGFEWLTTDAVGTHIDEIAEQMKEGGSNEQ